MEAGPTDGVSRPKPARRTLVLVLIPIIAVTVVGTIGNAIHPQLVKDHPLWLVAMEPRTRYLVLVANKVEFLPFLLIATVRKLFSDPFFYALGYLYGDAGVRWIERKMGEGGASVRAVERGFKRAGPLMVFLLPGAIVCTLAGATGMNPLLFLALNVAGTLTVVTVAYRFAELSWVAGPLDAITGFYGRNTRWLLAASIALTAWWLIDQRRRGRSEIEKVSTIERELEEAAADEDG